MLNLSTYYLQPWATEFFSNYKLTDKRKWIIDYLDNTYDITVPMTAAEMFDTLLLQEVDPDYINFIDDLSNRLL